MNGDQSFNQERDRRERKLPDGLNVMPANVEFDMDQDTKHEIVVLTLSTLAAVPIVTGVGLAIVAGILAW